MFVEPRPPKCGEELGRGSFGTVFQGINHETGALMAIKVFDLNGMAPEGIDAISSEIRILQQLDHPNVVKYYDSRVRRDGHLEVHMELVPGGTIGGALRQFGPLSENCVRRYVRDTLAALAYVHENDLVHGDLKPCNLLLGVDGSVKLSDFGESALLEEQHAHCLHTNLSNPGELRGTLSYMAPEVVRGQRATQAADVWAAGCTIYEMLSGTAPFPPDGWSLPSYANFVGLGGSPWEAEPTPSFSHFTPACVDLLLACLHTHPSKRPSARALLEHPFLRAGAPVATDGAAWSASVPVKVASRVLRCTNMPDRRCTSEPPSPRGGAAGGDVLTMTARGGGMAADTAKVDMRRLTGGIRPSQVVHGDAPHTSSAACGAVGDVPPTVVASLTADATGLHGASQFPHAGSVFVPTNVAPAAWTSDVTTTSPTASSDADAMDCIGGDGTARVPPAAATALLRTTMDELASTEIVAPLVATCVDRLVAASGPSLGDPSHAHARGTASANASNASADTSLTSVASESSAANIVTPSPRPPPSAALRGAHGPPFGPRHPGLVVGGAAGGRHAAAHACHPPPLGALAATVTSISAPSTPASTALCGPSPARSLRHVVFASRAAALRQRAAAAAAQHQLNPTTVPTAVAAYARSPPPALPGAPHADGVAAAVGAAHHEPAYPLVPAHDIASTAHPLAAGGGGWVADEWDGTPPAAVVHAAPSACARGGTPDAVSAWHAHVHAHGHGGSARREKIVTARGRGWGIGVAASPMPSAMSPSAHAHAAHSGPHARRIGGHSTSPPARGAFGAPSMSPAPRIAQSPVAVAPSLGAAAAWAEAARRGSVPAGLAGGKGKVYSAAAARAGSYVPSPYAPPHLTAAASRALAQVAPSHTELDAYHADARGSEGDQLALSLSPPVATDHPRGGRDAPWTPPSLHDEPLAASPPVGVDGPDCIGGHPAGRTVSRVAAMDTCDAVGPAGPTTAPLGSPSPSPRVASLFAHTAAHVAAAAVAPHRAAISVHADASEDVGRVHGAPHTRTHAAHTATAAAHTPSGRPPHGDAHSAHPTPSSSIRDLAARGALWGSPALSAQSPPTPSARPRGGRGAVAAPVLTHTPPSSPSPPAVADAWAPLLLAPLATREGAMRAHPDTTPPRTATVLARGASPSIASGPLDGAVCDEGNFSAVGAHRHVVDRTDRAAAPASHARALAPAPRTAPHAPTSAGPSAASGPAVGGPAGASRVPQSPAHAPLRSPLPRSTLRPGLGAAYAGAPTTAAGMSHPPADAARSPPSPPAGGRDALSSAARAVAARVAGGTRSSQRASESAQRVVPQAHPAAPQATAGVAREPPSGRAAAPAGPPGRARAAAAQPASAHPSSSGSAGAVGGPAQPGHLAVPAAPAARTRSARSRSRTAAVVATPPRATPRAAAPAAVTVGGDGVADWIAPTPGPKHTRTPSARASAAPRRTPTRPATAAPAARLAADVTPAGAGAARRRTRTRSAKARAAPHAAVGAHAAPHAALAALYADACPSAGAALSAIGAAAALLRARPAVPHVAAGEDHLHARPSTAARPGSRGSAGVATTAGRHAAQMAAAHERECALLAQLHARRTASPLGGQRSIHAHVAGGGGITRLPDVFAAPLSAVAAVAPPTMVAGPYAQRAGTATAGAVGPLGGRVVPATLVARGAPPSPPAAARAQAGAPWASPPCGDDAGSPDAHALLHGPASGLAALGIAGVGVLPPCGAPQQSADTPRGLAGTELGGGRHALRAMCPNAARSAAATGALAKGPSSRGGAHPLQQLHPTKEHPRAAYDRDPFGPQGAYARDPCGKDAGAIPHRAAGGTHGAAPMEVRHLRDGRILVASMEGLGHLAGGHRGVDPWPRVPRNRTLSVQAGLAGVAVLGF